MTHNAIRTCMALGFACLVFAIAKSDGQEGNRPVPENNSNRANRKRKRFELPPETHVEKDLVYATVGKMDLKLDFYRPKSAQEPLPLIIWIHGGAWMFGKKTLPHYLIPLLSDNFAVACVEYRLTRTAIFPAAIQDCRAAVSYLRHNAKTLKINPKRFAAFGRSAGGHLAALLGTTTGSEHFLSHAITKKASSDVQAVCDWFGPTDFLRMGDFKSKIDHNARNSPESKFIGGPIQENKAQATKANPITYIGKKTPPFLIIHGDKDSEVPYNQSELLHAALEKAGIQSTLHKAEGGGHGFGGAKGGIKPILKMTFAFFQKQLKPGIVIDKAEARK